MAATESRSKTTLGKRSSGNEIVILYIFEALQAATLAIADELCRVS